MNLEEVQKEHIQTLSQSKVLSIAEACSNTIIGYFLSLAVQILVFPMFGVHLSLKDNAMLTVVFTAVSIARGYYVRRWFNRIQQKERNNRKEIK